MSTTSEVEPDTRLIRFHVPERLYQLLKGKGEPEEIAREALLGVGRAIEAEKDAAGPAEKILVLAPKVETANFWVQLNRAALVGDDPAGVLIVTAGNGQADRFRGFKADRLIVIDHPQPPMQDAAMIACGIGDALAVVRVGFVDRLAAGWRTA